MALAAAALALAPAACRDTASRDSDPGAAPGASRPGDAAPEALPDPAPPPGTGNAACELLTVAELGSAVGAAVSSSTPAELGVGGLPGVACIHVFEGPGAQAVMVSRSDSPEAERLLEQVRSRAGDRARPVPGIDDAVVVPQEAYLRKGSVLVSVTLSLDQDETHTAETAGRLIEAVARRV